MDKIICVGKNYLKHAKELGDAIPEEPIYFLKPPSVAVSIESPGQVVDLPAEGDIHHELELVFKVRARAGKFEFSHFTLGLDLTLRDLQQKLKKLGYPWEKAKVFKHSAILGPWQELRDLDSLMQAEFTLKINGQLRQHGQGRDMRWGPLATIKDLQQWFPICDGDLLFTGTPEGVGPLVHGDRLEICGPGLDFTLTISRQNA